MAKVKRADAHFTEVEKAWSDILSQPGSYSDEVEIRDDGREHIYRALAFPEVDPEWGLALGDCTHNLRTALDHLAWQLVLANGGTPVVRMRGTQFPIVKGPGTITIEGGVDPDALKIIQDIQPNNGGYDGKNLALINDLDIMDKHHYVIATELPVETWAKHDPNTSIPTRIASAVGDPTRGLQAGDEMARFRYDPPLKYRDPNLKLQPGITFVEGPLAGQSFKELGIRVAWLRDDFLPRFARFF